MLEYYATQSPFSDPGRHADWLDDTPADIGRLREIAAGLVFHYWGNGDPTRQGFPPERLAEIDLRYAEAILDRARELKPTPLGAERAPEERVLGCCRDYTLLLVTMARHHGIPARSRVGFGNYLWPGWHLDHVVAEIWDGDRWRLVEPGFATHDEVDVMDVPRDRFLVGPDAWRACRGGALDPATVVVAPHIEEPFLRGFPYARHNLVLDLAALNKHEMVLWDVWADADLAPEVSPAVAVRADELAAIDPTDLPALQAAFAAPDVTVPPIIRTINPLTHLPRRVTLSDTPNARFGAK
jgi:AcrR family transcriptional regulator